MKYLGLIIAICVAGLAAYMVLTLSGEDEKRPPLVMNKNPIPQQNPQPMQISQPVAPQVETANVYVASNYIPIGTIIEENMLTVQPWPKHLLLDGFVVGADQGKKIIGTVTRAPFQAFEPIIKTKTVNPDDPNFIAGALPKGKRLVTIAVDEISGLGGFVFPGDHVDIVIRHQILKEGVTERDIREADREEDIMEEVSEILVPNVKVLAVDQRSQAGVGEDGKIIIPKSVSMEVTPEDAQRVVLARRNYSLTVSLRSIKDKDSTEKVAITRQSDLSQFNISSIAAGEEEETEQKSDGSPVKIIRGTEIEVLSDEDE